MNSCPTSKRAEKTCWTENEHRLQTAIPIRIHSENDNHDITAHQILHQHPTKTIHSHPNHTLFTSHLTRNLPPGPASTTHTSNPIWMRKSPTTTTTQKRVQLGSILLSLGFSPRWIYVTRTNLRRQRFFLWCPHIRWTTLLRIYDIYDTRYGLMAGLYSLMNAFYSLSVGYGSAGVKVKYSGCLGPRTPEKLFREQEVENDMHRHMRFLSTTAVRSVWSDFTKRPASLKVANDAVRKCLISGIDPDVGPASITEPAQKTAYHSPLHIDEVFQASYKLLEEQSEKYYSKIDELEAKKATVEDEDLKIKLQKRIDQLRLKAEDKNPEVLYNARFAPGTMDPTQPVYRKYMKEAWKDYDLMITMQRVEQLKMIPDTLPTFEPTTDVKVKFPHNTEAEFVGAITPGTILPTFAVSRPPQISVTNFDSIQDKALYTVLLVNPDTPDLEANSFSTTLHYGLHNVALDNVNCTIDPKLDSDPHVFKSYEPLVPEKNAQLQRACLWVLKQSQPLHNVTVEKTSKFDIRAFVEKHALVPVGAHIWRQQFDRSVNAIRAEYGLPAGRVFARVRRPHPMP